jgi:hypothetical protein
MLNHIPAKAGTSKDRKPDQAAANDAAARRDFPSPMPEWFPDFVRELGAMSPADRREILRELDAKIAKDEARAEAAKQKRERDKARDGAIAKAKKLGVDVTVAPNGAATFHTGTASAPDDKPQTEVDEWIEKHAH